MTWEDVVVVFLVCEAFSATSALIVERRMNGKWKAIAIEAHTAMQQSLKLTKELTELVSQLPDRKGLS